MKEERCAVIAREHLPVQFPTIQTLVVALALDYWNAPSFLVGMVGMVMLSWWAGAVLRARREEPIKLEVGRGK